MAQAITVRSHAPALPRAAFPAVPVSLLEWCLLVVLMVAAPLLYLPIVMHNLPVAAGIDERNALEVIRRFHQGSLNPQFFQYPTIYFYLVYLLALPLHYNNVNVMMVGRLFDLLLIGVIAYLVFMFCRDRLHSRIAGLIAATFVLGSTVLSGTTYLHPDLLMTVAGTASLYYLVDYFETRSQRAWLLGLVFMGLSIGCKYTAFILFLGYAATEVLESLRTRGRDTGRRGDVKRFSRTFCISFLAIAGMVLMLSSWLLPLQSILSALLRVRALYQAGPGSYYVEVFGRLRRTLAELGLLSFAIALLCRFSRNVYESISIKRLYLGLGIILAISVLCTPYSVLHPAQFIFDLGSLTRSNIVIAGGHLQWVSYAEWMVAEGALPVLVGFAGVALFIKGRGRHFYVVAVYLAMYLYVLGSAHRGYIRYLAPVVPLLYCGAGIVIVHLWSSSGRTGTGAQSWGKGRLAAVLIIAASPIQMIFNIVHNRQLARTNNSFYASYVAAKNATTGTAYYVGWAPSIELEEAGIKTKELIWTRTPSGPLGDTLACGDTLTLNTPHSAKYDIDAPHDSSVVVMIDAPGDGLEEQEVLRRSACP